MSDGKHGSEPTQTTPKGVKIPVPPRGDFLGNLAKVAPPVEPPAKADEPGDEG